MNQQVGIIGTSIWQQNFPLLESLTLDREKRAESLHLLKQALGVQELVYLATCNRVEFLYVAAGAGDTTRVLHRLIDFFFSNKGGVSFFPNDFYHFTAKEAVSHLFRTVSSLESLVVGETQITGQFKQALEDANADGLTGPILDSLGREALQVARQVKRETTIGNGALSMASLAATETVARLDGLKNPRIALVGSGSMTQKLANYFKESLPADLVFVNRTVEKAEKFAAEFGGEAMSLADFLAQPGGIDAIMSATAAPEEVFGADFLERLPSRDHLVVCVDLAIPRDFAIDFISDKRVKLIDIPYLKAKGQSNLRQKFVETSKANEIVRDAVNKYLASRVEVNLKPIFNTSYQESLRVAKNALEDLFAKRVTGLDDTEKQALHRLVAKLVGQSSFQPVRMLSDRLVAARSDLVFDELEMIRKEAV